MHIESNGNTTLRECEVAFVISDLGVGGAQRVLVNLANRLTSDGYRIALITVDSTDSDYFRIDGRIQRIALGMKQPSQDFINAIASNVRRIKSLRNVLRDMGTACIVSFVGTMNILTILATRYMGARVIISERNDPARESLGVFWDFMRRLVYGRADVVTANSKGAIASLSRYVPPGKLLYVPNVMTRMSSKGRAGSRENWILAVGRLERQKGYDVLLEAFSRLRRTAPDWVLVIVGSGSLEPTLRKLAGELDIPIEKIIWKGQVDPYPLYLRSSIYVLPSRYEGTPNTLLEALQCGLAAVVSDASSGALEYIVHRETGMVVPVDHPQELSNILGELITNPQLRRQLGEAGQSCVDATDPEAVIATWKNLLQLEPNAAG